MTRPTLDKIWTVLDVVKWATSYFEDKDVDSPRLTIEMMVCHVLDVGRIKLYTDFDRPLTKDELATLREMITRRVRHEPLQYIIGKADFYGSAFLVNPSVLIPRPETELIVEYVIKWSGQREVRCLDIGTGSGCIAIASAEKSKQSTWLCVDVSDDACGVAIQNAMLHNVSDRVTVQQVDILAEVPAGTFDVITMNPPYIPAHDIPELEEVVRDFEPNIALTDHGDGLTFYKRLADILRTTDMLDPDGIVAMEIGYGQVDDVLLLFSDQFDSTVINDLQETPRIVILRRLKGQS